jgi:hypothetical protein
MKEQNSEQKPSRLEKISGKHRFNLNGNLTTKDWDINDVGFSTKTNFANYNAWYGYRISAAYQNIQ